MQSKHEISTAIWQELPAPDGSGLITGEARCHGYDVYGDLLKQVTWAQMVFLMFRGELPTSAQLAVFEMLAVALANPGPREPSVTAAMASGVVRTPPATWLVAALSTGSGRAGGARDLRECMEALETRGLDVQAWHTSLRSRPADSIWPACDHPAGFASAGPLVGPLVAKTLVALHGCALAEKMPAPALDWLMSEGVALTQAAAPFGWAISFPLVSACALSDLGFSAEEGELLYLMLRMPGAAAHASEQSQRSFLQYPFPPLEHVPDPSAKETV
jgi:citrate synthase